MEAINDRICRKEERITWVYVLSILTNCPTHFVANTMKLHLSYASKKKVDILVKCVNSSINSLRHQSKKNIFQINSMNNHSINWQEVKHKILKGIQALSWECICLVDFIPHIVSSLIKKQHVSLLCLGVSISFYIHCIKEGICRKFLKTCFKNCLG
jgi:hypothetical protein